MAPAENLYRIDDCFNCEAKACRAYPFVSFINLHLKPTVVTAIKLFLFIINSFSKYAWVFAPDKFSFVCKCLILDSTEIETNTLAYFVRAFIKEQVFWNQELFQSKAGPFGKYYKWLRYLWNSLAYKNYQQSFSLRHGP
jgi:hypothetical protein